MADDLRGGGGLVFIYSIDTRMHEPYQPARKYYGNYV